jgi:hypothetical protein
MKHESTKAHLPWLRARLQSSGATYYYLEIPNAKPRREIALGKDLEVALATRRSWLLQFLTRGLSGQSTAVVALAMYKEIEVPRFQRATQIENFNAIKRLVAFLHANERFSEINQETDLLNSYQNWIGVDLKIRARSDIAFFKMVLKSVSKWP